MLEYQLTDMRRTVMRMLLRRRPPLTILITREHADYLKLDYQIRTDVQVPVSQAPPGSKMKKHPELAEVRLQDIVVSLKGAKGVEHNIDAAG